ncbi:glycine-rich domain-containing protein [Noviherbaspirillum galbum]|uniref:glycine-rich domain-containing protein n=1 Tax=Noviherbaspirillum galbum TaxID=2709383 RepID=UPI001969E12C|nr:hypothetical protein [Noviherbaspirillum galbum]
MQFEQEKNPGHVERAVAELDLDPIKFKLMDKEEGEGWSRAEVDQAEREYRRYLVLLGKYPDEVIAPSRTVDKFWHAHILDTMKYAQDCDAVFGYFLHHFPYFGLRGEDDAANLAKAAENMQRLYVREFGAAGEEASGYCARAAQDAAYCARSTAYCAKATAYCAKATAYCAKTTATEAAAYCARTSVAASGAKQSAEDPAYCARAAKSNGVQASYCAKAPASMMSHDVVTAKGRPLLEPVPA